MNGSDMPRTLTENALVSYSADGTLAIKVHRTAVIDRSSGWAALEGPRDWPKGPAAPARRRAIAA